MAKVKHHGKEVMFILRLDHFEDDDKRKEVKSRKVVAKMMQSEDHDTLPNENSDVENDACFQSLAASAVGAPQNKINPETWLPQIKPDMKSVIDTGASCIGCLSAGAHELEMIRKRLFASNVD